MYLRYAKDYGCQLTEHEILHRFRRCPAALTFRLHISAEPLHVVMNYFYRNQRYVQHLPRSAMMLDYCAVWGKPLAAAAGLTTPLGVRAPGATSAMAAHSGELNLLLEPATLKLATGRLS